jgi:hypothetical protein
MVVGPLLFQNTLSNYRGTNLQVVASNSKRFHESETFSSAVVDLVLFCQTVKEGGRGRRAESSS